MYIQTNSSLSRKDYLQIIKSSKCVPSDLKEEKCYNSNCYMEWYVSKMIYIKHKDKNAKCETNKVDIEIYIERCQKECQARKECQFWNLKRQVYNECR